MKAILKGGARDGQEIDLAREVQHLVVPYIDAGDNRATSAEEAMARLEWDGERWRMPGPKFRNEQYVFDGKQADGTLVYGCIGVID